MDSGSGVKRREENKTADSEERDSDVNWKICGT